MRRYSTLPLVLIVAGCMSSSPVRTKAIPIGSSAAKSSGPVLTSVEQKSPSPAATSKPTATPVATPTPSGTATPKQSPTPTPTPTPTPDSGVGGVVYHNPPPVGATPTPIPFPGAPGAQGVSTFAGRGNAGFIDAGLLDSEFTQPYGLAVQGTTAMYVADRGGQRIRRIDLTTSQVTTLAGSGVAGYRDAIGQQAQFKNISALAVDAQGMVYVADTGNNVIRKIDTADLANANVTTLAGVQGAGGKRDGAGMQALFSSPWAMVMVGRTMYVADAGNNCIRTVDLDAAVVGTYAGTGAVGTTDGAALTTAKFSAPNGLAIDTQNNIYVAESGNHNIRRIDYADPSHAVTTVAGKGAAGFRDADGTLAAFNGPSGILVTADGNLLVADTGNHLIRKVDMSTVAHTVTTWAGMGTAGFFDGPSASAKFSSPVGLAWLGAGLFVADSGNFRIRQVQ